MPSPRVESVTGPTTASAYTQERRLLRAYHRLLAAADLDALAAAAFAPNPSASRQAAADERLEHVMPEVLQRLKPHEQEPLAEWLLGESPDLAAAVRYLVKKEHWVNHHQADPRLKVNDDALCRAAGIGRLARADPGSFRAKAVPAPVAVPLGPPLVLTPWPPVAVRFRGVRARRPARSSVQCVGQLVLVFPGGGAAGAGL